MTFCRTDMTAETKPCLLGNYIEQEIRDRFDDDEDLPNDEEINAITLAILQYVDNIICDQINNALF